MHDSCRRNEGTGETNRISNAGEGERENACIIAEL